MSNRTATTNGQSLLKAIKDALDTSLAGTVWTVKLSAGYKVQLSHDNGLSRTITFDAALKTSLGFDSANGAGNTVVVANGTTVTATYFSLWWWTPNMSVSETQPIAFDPSISYGVPRSAGTAQRSSDMTTAYTDNAVQLEATYIFRGVQYYYVIRPQSGYTNNDLETWWSNGPRKGRRLLMWRDRDNAVGSNAPSEGSASPWNYIEYAPNETLRSTFPAAPIQPTNLAFWDVSLGLWVTENGETPLTD